MKNFKILKGKHSYQGWTFGFNWWNKSHNWTFDGLPWYSIKDVEHTGINKLCGMTFGLDHHENSFRIGWQPNFTKKGYITLSAYYYIDGVQIPKRLCDIPELTKNEVFVFLDKDEGVISVVLIPEKGWSKTFSIEHNHISKFGYFLYPYFGGKSVSPLDMNIYLNHG